MALLVAVIAIGPPVSAWAQGAQKKVLVLHSRRSDAEFSVLADREMPGLFDRGVGSKVDYYAEHMDAARLPDPQYRVSFRNLLELKYRGVRFDVVIATYQLAVDFLNAYRGELFPDTPIVYLTEDRGVVRMPNSTGIVAERDYRRTLALALQLQPDTSRVFVVSGSSARDRLNEQDARQQFASLSPRLDFTYLTGLTSQETEQQLATLPPRSIVFYLVFYQDAAGVNFLPAEYFQRVAAASNRPVYSWVDWTLGRGAVGGSLVSTDGEIDAVTSLAIRVLRGERPDDISILVRTLDSNQVDWRQLQRWSIPETRLPSGTQVLFRVPDLLDRYGFYVAGVLVLVLAQTTFIGILFFQQGQRRRAEERARRSEAELRVSYERIRDLGGRLIAAQDAERARIARELHDDISQQVALVALELQMLTDAYARHEADAEALGLGLIDRVRMLGRSLHEMSHQLHPAKLRLIGLVAAIDGLRREFSRPGMAVVFAHENVPAELPHDITLALFRVVQEAVRNAVEHSGARQVSVRLAATAQGLSLTIEDDGSGFEVGAASFKGLGLISMRERLDSIGGTLTIHSSPGVGTRLEIEVAYLKEVAPTVGSRAAGASGERSVEAAAG